MTAKNWTCRSCKHCDKPDAECTTWCNLYNDEYGAQIVLYARDLDTKMCDRWQPRMTNNKDSFTAECKKYGFEPTYVSCKNDVIFGWFLDKQVSQMFHLWETDPEKVPGIMGISRSTGPLPKIYSDGTTPEVPVYVVFDNEGGEFFMEDFFSKKLAMEWIINCADPWDLHIADNQYIKERLAANKNNPGWVE